MSLVKTDVRGPVRKMANGFVARITATTQNFFFSFSKQKHAEAKKTEKDKSKTSKLPSCPYGSKCYRYVY